jgi:hypothetical protein
VVGTQISHPALECPSRLCLITKPTDSTGTGGGSVDAGTGGTLGNSANGRATCTAECQSDGDCTPETTVNCKKGFVCAVATSTDSSYCCKKLCICREDLQPMFNVDNNGGVVTPTGCDPHIAANVCANLH